MFWRTFPARVWLIGLFLMVGLSAVFYLVLGRETKLSITKQLLHQEQTIARAEASNVVSFFQVFGDSVAVLSQLDSIERMDTDSIRVMDIFVEQWRDYGLVGGVVLTDGQGVVRFNSNVTGTYGIGASLSDRDYFVWAKNQPEKGKYFIGQPVVSRLGAGKGQVIVPVAAAVHQQDVFAGVLAASVKLEPLTNSYLGVMEVADEADVYLIDQYGDLLYSNFVSDATESNIFELSQTQTFSDNQVLDEHIKNVLYNVTTGKAGGLQTETHLIAFSPIFLNGQKWLLVTTSPIKGVTDLAVPFYVRQTSMLVLMFLIIMLFGIAVSKGSRNQT